MNWKIFAELVFYISSYSIVFSCFADTIYIVLTLDSRTNLASAGLAILLVDSAFVIIYFISCFATEPGEIKENINIRDLPEESKYIPPDSIDQDDITPAKVYFCSLCNLCRPPHGVHCDICQKCILYRYNHNLFFKKCIGYYNFKFHANLYFYIAIGLIIVFSLNYEIMKNSKTPSYDSDHVFMLMYSALFAIYYLMLFVNMIKAATNISYLLQKNQDIYGSTSWYENLQIFFGKKLWIWFFPFKVSLIENLAIDLRLNTHYGGVIKLNDKFII